jgi:alpha-glucosidase
LIEGDCRILALPEPLFGFVRNLDDDGIVCIFNLHDESSEIGCGALPQCTPLLDSGFSVAQIDGRYAFAAYDAYFGRLRR